MQRKRKNLMRLAQAVFRNRQRHDIDALFAQVFDFIMRSIATDFALGRFLVMDLARLFGKRIAYVVGIRDKVLDQLREFAADVRILRCTTFRCALGGIGNLALVYMRRMQCLVDLTAAADRAAQQRALLLLIEIGGRRKPSLESVLVAAGQIENDHI